MHSTQEKCAKCAFHTCGICARCADGLFFIWNAHLAHFVQNAHLAHFFIQNAHIAHSFANLSYRMHIWHIFVPYTHLAHFPYGKHIWHIFLQNAHPAHFCTKFRSGIFYIRNAYLAHFLPTECTSGILFWYRMHIWLIVKCRMHIWYLFFNTKCTSHTFLVQNAHVTHFFWTMHICYILHLKWTSGTFFW